jgi:hypothetical protein
MKSEWEPRSPRGPEALESWASDFSLSESSQRMIRGLLREAEEDLTSLDNEISTIKVYLEKLSRQRKSDFARISKLRAGAAPIKRVPTEILSEIFRLCISSLRIPITQSDTTPWKLSHVCSHWRELVLHTPKLWSNLSIRDIRGFKGAVVDEWDNKIRAVLNEVLSHTDGPLSLTIYCAELDPFMDILLTITHRLKVFSLHALEVKHFHFFLSLPPHSFRLLEELEMTICTPRVVIPLASIPPSNPQIHETAPFHTAHRLKRVYFGQHYDIPPLRFLPLAQLTCLELDTYFPRPSGKYNIYAALQQCTSLISCKITITGRSWGDSAHRKPIAFPHLENIKFTVLDPLNDNYIFDLFIVPKLQDLFIEYENRTQSPFSTTTLTSFITRSNCTLRKLKVYDVRHRHGGGYTELEGLESFLTVVPTLVSFSSSFVIPPIVFQQMKLGEVLPQLKDSSLTVQPEGFAALLDVWDYYSLKPPVQMRRFTVHCHQGAEFKRVYKRYCESYSNYQALGCLVLRVLDSNTLRILVVPQHNRQPTDDASDTTSGQDDTGSSHEGDTDSDDDEETGSSEDSDASDSSANMDDETRLDESEDYMVIDSSFHLPSTTTDANAKDI